MKTIQPMKAAQAGLTMWQLAMVLIVVGFIATAVIKLGPAYADNRVVTKALEDIHQNYNGANMQEVKDKEILDKLGRYFQVNMVGNEIEKSAKVTRVREHVILSINYEVRSNFMANIDTVLVFNNEVDLAK